MEYRELGKTGLRVSALGFGCGNVGGLMIRGTAAERERAIARAVELGINYFDTAPSYGDGQSEQNLGAALRSRRATVYVGTKFRLDAADLRDVRRAIGHSLDASLKRLGMERVDLLQLHNNIFGERGAQPVSPSQCRWWSPSPRGRTMRATCSGPGRCGRSSRRAMRGASSRRRSGLP